MDIESKIWSLTNTGTRLHAFKGGVALCSKAVRERQGPGEGFDYCEAKQGPFKLCTRCDAKFNSAIQAAEAAVDTSGCTCPPSYAANDYHKAPCPLTPAEAPECTCPRMERKYYGGDKPHHPGCATRTPNNPKKEDQPMGYDQRKRTGPLAPGQIKIIEGLIDGRRQSEIAREMHVSASHVSAEARLAASRMGVETTSAACARWATAKAYIAAAELIERDIDYTGDDRVSEVLRELAKLLRDRAGALTPA